MDPILEAVGNNGQMALFDDRVVISRKGALAFFTQGLKGSKEIPLGRITAVQFKEAGTFTSGYLQLSVEGELSAKGGLLDATKDENTVMFTKHAKHTPEAWAQMRDRIKAHVTSGAKAAPVASPAGGDALDQLKKLAELRDAGIVSEEEFAAKKAQLLGL